MAFLRSHLAQHELAKRTEQAGDEQQQVRRKVPTKSYYSFRIHTKQSQRKKTKKASHKASKSPQKTETGIQMASSAGAAPKIIVTEVKADDDDDKQLTSGSIELSTATGTSEEAQNPDVSASVVVNEVDHETDM